MSETFRLVPTIKTYQQADEFFAAYPFKKTDIILTFKSLAQSFLAAHRSPATLLVVDDFGKGEPTDEMIEKIIASLPKQSFTRVFGIGGGSVLDIAKLLALQTNTPVSALFSGQIIPQKARELLLIPTTCGTGSEVTNVSVCALVKKQTKGGLAHDALYADTAILVPEFLAKLPKGVFATSSIDAFIHAIESYLSPKATSFSQSYSKQAMALIITSYQRLAVEGFEVLADVIGEVSQASLLAGIAFGNAGCGTVHAMSYPFGAKFHVPHGESNYVLFQAVFDKYVEQAPAGQLAELLNWLGQRLDVAPAAALQALNGLFADILPLKPLHEYGMTAALIPTFAKLVIDQQQRLMANSYVPLTEQEVAEIYRNAL